MQTVLQEFTAASAAHLRIDREAGVLRGVKLLGLTSSNGRRYLESALREAAPLYEGAKVNVNHATDDKGGPLAPRGYQDRLGVIRHVAFRKGEGLFGDLHFNPKHALAEQLAWDAEHAPQNVGLSHNVLARTATRGKETIVERIEKVQSVDIVADPATTKGLFECGIRNAECGMKEPQIHDPSNPQFEIPNPQPAEFVRRARRIFELLTEHKLPLPGSSNSGPYSNQYIRSTRAWLPSGCPRHFLSYPCISASTSASESPKRTPRVMNTWLSMSALAEPRLSRKATTAPSYAFRWD